MLYALHFLEVVNDVNLAKIVHMSERDKVNSNNGYRVKCDALRRS
jgi:hypothetical protein